MMETLASVYSPPGEKLLTHNLLLMPPHYEDIRTPRAVLYSFTTGLSSHWPYEKIH